MKTTLALLILFTAGSTFAQRGGEGGGGGGGERREPPSAADLIERLDTDNDGKISQDEFDGPDEHFTQFDQNGDGYLSESEIPTRPPSRGQEGDDEGERPEQGQCPQRGGDNNDDSKGFISLLDTDNDGKVSQDEFDGPDDAFSELDKDNDGYVSEDEAPKGPPPRGERR